MSSYYSVSAVEIVPRGAVGDGVADDTAALQAAIDEAAGVSSSSGVGAIVRLRPGTYKVTAALTIDEDGISVVGAGSRATAIVSTSTTEHLFSMSSNRDLVLQGLTLEGAGSGDVDGVHLEAPDSYAIFNCAFRDLFIKDFGRHGFYAETLCASVLEKVRVETCGGSGFYLLDGGTSLTLNSCYANGCTEYGYRLSGLVYSVLNACATDSCSTGYFINTCTALALNACGAESTTTPGHGFAIYNGTTSVSLIGCYALNIHGDGAGYKVGANGGLNCSRIMINTCRVLGATTPAYSLQVDSANQATLVAFQKHPSAANATTGTVTYLADENTGDNYLAGDLSFTPVGKGLKIKAGTNGRIGTASLSSGTVTINNSSVGSSTTVLAMAYNIVGTPGFLAMSGRSNGVSFTITSYKGDGTVNTDDNSSFTWMLVERT